jgi:hypothetical protein
MSLFRRLAQRTDSSGLGIPASPGHVEKRRALGGLSRAGSLACARCDAPVALGADALRLTDRLGCPFCGNEGPLREFLSLAEPTRPAHVVVRVIGRSD